MKRRSLLAVAAFFAAMALPGAASAQSVAYTAGGGYTNMRAGPGTNYPVVLTLGPGTQVFIYGCLSTRDWCDAAAGQVRAWISTTRLEFAYAGRRVLVPNYYTYFAPPIVVFNYGNWPRPYRPYRPPNPGKPWFGHPGGGSGGPVYRDRPGRGLENVPRRGVREDGSNPRRAPNCRPGSPNCVEGTR